MRKAHQQLPKSDIPGSLEEIPNKLDCESLGYRADENEACMNKLMARCGLTDSLTPLSLNIDLSKFLLFIAMFLIYYNRLMLGDKSKVPAALCSLFTLYLQKMSVQIFSGNTMEQILNDN